MEKVVEEKDVYEGGETILIECDKIRNYPFELLRIMGNEAANLVDGFAYCLGCSDLMGDGL